MGFKETKISSFQMEDNQKTHTDCNATGLIFLPQRMKRKFKKQNKTQHRP